MRLVGLVFLPLVLGLAATAYALGRRRLPPEALERLRRANVNARGRMAGAVVIDFSDDQLYYSYSVGGVEYTAAQDISSVRDRLPADPADLSGTATVKYLPGNPADSIVISEDWTGVRARPASPVGGQDEGSLL